jgi:predicted HicB family RNase H-like nuclease
MPQSCPNCGTEILPKTRETLRVITVRMPKSLHDQLTAEARTAGVSMNTVCVRKLQLPLREVPGELAATG